MVLHAIKAVYDRKTKTYGVQYETGEGGDAIAFINSGFYVTDSLPATLGRLVAGCLEWWNGMPAAKQEAIKEWLIANVR